MLLCASGVGLSCKGWTFATGCGQRWRQSSCVGPEGELKGRWRQGLGFVFGRQDCRAMRLSEDHTPWPKFTCASGSQERPFDRPDVPGERKRIESEGAARVPNSIG